MIRFFEAASTEGLLSSDGPSNPIVICCVDPQVVFVTTKEANAGFEEIHAMLHRFGFAQWTFRSMNSRSVRLPGHEWWLLHNPDLRQCSVIIENLSNIIDYQIIDVEGYLDIHFRVKNLRYRHSRAKTPRGWVGEGKILSNLSWRWLM